MPQQVLNPGFDPTAYVELTGAQIAQLFDQATFATTVGGIIVTQDDGGGNPSVPNPNIDATLTTYVWIRIGTPNQSGNFAVAYIWNPNSANPTSPTVLLNWNPITAASIPPGSIQGYQIAPNTIPASALIGGISASQVIGLAALFNTALTSASTPNGGSVNGSFGSGFNLTAGAVNAASILAAGILNSPSLFSGQPILPGYIDTSVAISNPAIYSVLMAINGPGNPATWALKQILVLPEPNPALQSGYIPVVQPSGAYALQSPTSTFPAGAISAAAEVSGTGTITVSSIGTGPTAVSTPLSTLGYAGIVFTNPSAGSTVVFNTAASTTALIPGQTYVTLSGLTNKLAALNNVPCLVIATTTNVSFTIFTTTSFSGSTASAIPTCHFCNYLTSSSNLNVGNSALLCTGGINLIPSVQWLATGEYLVTMVVAKGSANYLAFAQVLDTYGSSQIIAAKVVGKTTAAVTIAINNSNPVGATDNADVSVIIL